MLGTNCKIVNKGEEAEIKDELVEFDLEENNLNIWKFIFIKNDVPRNISLCSLEIYSF